MSLIIKKNTTFKIPRTGSGAPSGIPVASTSSIVVVGAGGVPSGTYDAQGVEDLVAAFEETFLAGLAPFYSKTQAGGNADLYFFLGPNASLLDFEGSTYHSNGSSWQIMRLFENEGLSLVSVGTNPSTNADYIPTSGWTPSITITAA